MPKPRTGLRVRYHDHVENFRSNTGTGAGWFVEVKANGRWTAVMNLRFPREKDGLRAVLSLTAAGLNTFEKLNHADGMWVKCVAAEWLDW